jgi:general L-amino acid transport system permease protein
MSTITQQEIRPPQRAGKLTWIRENLFRSWFDSILTVVGVSIIVFVAVTIGDWVLNEANWAPITEFPLLYLIGQYPREAMWRIGVLLWATSFLFGISWGLWGNLVRTFALMLGFFLAVLALFPTQSETYSISLRLALLANPVLIFFGYFIGRRRNFSGRVVLICWLALLILTVVLLSGVGGGSLLPIQTISLLFGFLFLYAGYLVASRLFASGRFILLLGFSLVFAISLATVIFYILQRIEASQILPVVGTSLWGGLLVTILLSVLGIIASFPIGVMLALGRRSDLPVVRWVSTAFIELVRGVPLVTILFMFSIILAIFLPAESRLDRLVRALIAMTFFSSAYMAENVRGGLQAIPAGQEEAAKALGLKNWQITQRIILPQALRLVIPTIVGQFITLFKDTTLAIIVGISELLFIGRSILNSNPEFVQHQAEVFFFIAIIFWLFSFVMSASSRQLESQLGVGQR